MRKELDEALCKKYPEIFRNRHGNMQETAMCWGMEHGDGWYGIIDALCASIQGHIDNNRRTIEWQKKELEYRELAAKGEWAFIYSRYEDKGTKECLDENPAWIEKKKQYYLNPSIKVNVEEEIPQVVATQVKEKYGTLRFYYAGGDDMIDGMVSMAEAMSERTCETCGAPGKLRTGGWLKTLCDHHAEEQGYDLTDEIG
jgi:hypothetical protein